MKKNMLLIILALLSCFTGEAQHAAQSGVTNDTDISTRAVSSEVEAEMPHIILDEIVILDYKTPLVQMDICFSSASAMQPNSVTRCFVTVDTLPKIKAFNNAVTVRSGRGNPSDYYIDGVRVRGNKTAESLKKAKNFTPPTRYSFREWDDLEKRQFETALLNRAGEDHLQHWPVFPAHRIFVEVINEDQYPISDCTLKLMDDNGLVVFQTKTNNAGQATLWHEQPTTKIIAEYNSTVSTAHPMTLQNDKPVKIKLPVPCKVSENLDIAFVVDASGSMDEKLSFFKTELADVMQQVRDRHKDFSIRTGCVVFRDHDDEYLTRSSSFSKDLQPTLDFLKAQTPTGGGDQPEAIDAALAAALKLDWNEHAATKILFLITDAPPHDQPEVLKNLHTQIQKAAAAGIRIIAIATGRNDESSGFSLKTMAAMTSGTFVFTDDERGNPESEITTTESLDRSLNEILVRLIADFSKHQDCSVASDPTQYFSEKQQPGDLSDELKNYLTINMYPNPASVEVFFELKEKYTAIRLVSVTGKTVKKIDYPDTGTIAMDIRDLPAGAYLVQFQHDEKTVNRRLVVARP